jgi:hypothetical protein
VSYGGPGRTCPLLKSPMLSGFPDTRRPARSDPILPFSDLSVARLLYCAELSRIRHAGFESVERLICRNLREMIRRAKRSLTRIFSRAERCLTRNPRAISVGIPLYEKREILESDDGF